MRNPWTIFGDRKSLATGDNDSLTAAGENKSWTVVGDSKSLIAEDEKSLVTVGD